MIIITLTVIVIGCVIPWVSYVDMTHSYTYDSSSSDKSVSGLALFNQNGSSISRSRKISHKHT